jgi:hypothetical protein
MEKAKAEYELMVERYKTLSAELANEENVIIRHKPTRVAPILIPATAMQSIHLTAEPASTMELPSPPIVGISQESERPIPDATLASRQETVTRPESGVATSPVVEKPRGSDEFASMSPVCS